MPGDQSVRPLINTNTNQQISPSNSNRLSSILNLGGCQSNTPVNRNPSPHLTAPVTSTSGSQDLKKRQRASSLTFGLLQSVTNSIRNTVLSDNSKSTENVTSNMNGNLSPNNAELSEPIMIGSNSDLEVTDNQVSSIPSPDLRSTGSDLHLHVEERDADLGSDSDLGDLSPPMIPPSSIDGVITSQAHQTHDHNNNYGEVPKRNKNGTYSIRLTPYVDSASASAALYFGPVVRRLKPGKTIAIGRYTEKNKEALTASPNSSSPVVFKSKVVSRTHAEIGVDEEGNWYIKDLKSSSGTFLNHRRLSLANQESDKTLFREGDLLQLGMDFRGGTEEIYRCVKMRIELNKSWIRRTKAFSKEAHERIKHLNPDKSGEEQIQCVICLDDINPCQAVFVSPCSHSYHYKCIRRVIVKTYPQFLCPTCRALSDLEADDDDDSEEDETAEEDVTN
ncbi:ubiquitin-conjugating protein [Saccharomycopsis crataegensis]|uniref:Ubiquitin-conjugating protein n=1 Tax=Saccharomycopsis crataegensis TaxID=43959 RepID=A0AAV5QMD4_9ASCO|nr:ubiquitin-conjugating protein [Saccharomycopsis crataegensis]